MSLLTTWAFTQTGALAQTGQTPAEQFYYVGTLDSLNIQLELSLEESQVSGSYFYDHVGLPLVLTGSLNEGELVLVEQDESGGVTGRFVGTFSRSPHETGSTIEGTWESGDGRRSLPFRLRKVAEYVTLSTHQSMLSVTSTYPFFPDESWACLTEHLQQKTLEAHVQHVREGQAGIREASLFHSWWGEDAYTIAYYDADLLSLLRTISSYTGGAHPNTWHESENYWLEQGGMVRIELEDLFHEHVAYLTFLSSYVLDELLEQEAHWVVIGQVTSLDESDLRVFTVSPQGLTFTFSAYEMGPYAQGPFFVTVPHEALTGLIDPQGPLGRFVQ